MEYPKWKTRGSPTPNDKLFVCDKGQHAEWGGHGFSAVSHCMRHNTRFREGTAAEYVEARKALKEVLG